MSQQSNQAPASLTRFGPEPEKKVEKEETEKEYESLEEALTGS